MKILKNLKVMITLLVLAVAVSALVALFAPWRIVALVIMGMILVGLTITILLLRYYTIRSVVDDRTGPRGYMSQLRSATQELNAAIAAFDQRMDRLEEELPERLSVRSAADLARMRNALLGELRDGSADREEPAGGTKHADA
ncbi:hypothetical protein J4H92_01340 [Leucobacter weissii]|uniref:Uncharacterized protein n=1 Tax=Leucobacter weissii TaxID=1983706 RepID=A0A939MI00_9MICO|nr:hypothetical protein [Leucobacter weissii]MBO1900590.1 hypothetical protein [Leucobacter weissii]